jgi:hypothetical protein
MTEKQLIVWLREEIKRAGADARMSTSTEDLEYHNGEYDALNSVLSMIGRA